MQKLLLSEQDRQLIDEAMTTLRSNFDDRVHDHRVAAALRCKNGKVYTGINCDCIHGSCAEFVAIGAAISAGERSFDTIVAVHEQAHNHVIAPCGNCRQMLFDYCPDIMVILNDEYGKIVKAGICDLLPLPYRNTWRDSSDQGEK